MNKLAKGAICVGLCGAMLFGMTGCGPEGRTRQLDTETRALNMSTGALDGNFNPFFYTAQNDGDIAAMTQVAMFTIDEDGNLAYGEDQPTVALDFRTRLYNAAGADITAGGLGDVNGRTEYEIIVKNGIKFSDGEPLTIKDVLFNLYVLLDPAYTGSNTLYSTDIRGLAQYRTQEENPDDDSANDGFRATADQDIQDIINWSTDSSVAEDAVDQEDLAIVKRLFREEVSSDWTSVQSSWETTYEETHNFTEAWQAYLYNEGLINNQQHQLASGGFEDVKGEDGKYITTLDPDITTGEEAKAKNYIDGVAEASSDAKVQEYIEEHTDDDGNTVTAEYAKLQLQREYCEKLVFDTFTHRTNIYQVVTSWATASTALDAFIARARTKHFEQLKEENDGLIYKSISGITTGTTSTDFSGNNIGEHDVLKIVIDGVDPKAKWNFSFTVAPLHYYSGEFEGVDYVDEFNGVDNFGVCFNNDEFFNTVLKNSEKNGLPVGAGAYQASNQRGQTGDAVNRGNFWNSGIVYFTRNEYFETLGSGISNAIIKNVTYKEMSDAKIIDALRAQEIDIGSPTASSDNLTEVGGIEHLAQVNYTAMGYGYVGINPKYVPELEIRRAIMKSMNISTAIRYFGSRLAFQIYRPMTSVSFVYNYEPFESDNSYKNPYPSVAYTANDQDIIELVEDAGYDKNPDTGKYEKGGKMLTYTFSIAGETSDHPAYQMFQDAAARLNDIGFDITVQTEIQALKLMNTGGLQVWAAAWSSSIDPDLYQVYHKDSNASNVRNWAYPDILNTNNYPRELATVNQLATLIDDARNVLDEGARSAIYAQALDKIMDLAVELPTYQRNDMDVYNTGVIYADSLNKNPSCYIGLFDKLWELDYV